MLFYYRYVAVLPSRSVGSPRTCSATTAMPTLQVNILFVFSHYSYDFTLYVFVNKFVSMCSVFSD